MEVDKERLSANGSTIPSVEVEAVARSAATGVKVGQIDKSSIPRTVNRSSPNNSQALLKRLLKGFGVALCSSSIRCQM